MPYSEYKGEMVQDGIKLSLDTEPGVRVLPRGLSILIGACGCPDEQRRVLFTGMWTAKKTNDMELWPECSTP